MCYLVPFIELSVSHTSVLTILAITVERYYAICLPLQVRQRRKCSENGEEEENSPPWVALYFVVVSLCSLTLYETLHGKKNCQNPFRNVL